MIKHHLLLTPWKKEIKTTGEIRENKRTKTTTFGDSKHMQYIKGQCKG